MRDDDYPEHAADDRRRPRPGLPDSQRDVAWRLLAVGGAAAFFILACASPVYQLKPTLTNPSPSVVGVEVLLVGWLGLLMGIVAWYANPVLALAVLLLLLGKNRGSCCCAVVALALGATSRWAMVWPSGNIAGHGPGQGSPEVVGWGPGLWLWLGSMALVAVSALWFWWRAEGRNHDRQEDHEDVWRAKLAGQSADPAAESD